MSYPGVTEDEQIVAAAAAATQGPVGIQPPSPLTQQQQAVANPYKITGWKKDDSHFDVVTPSGQRCRAKKLQFEEAISYGLLDDADLFTNALMSNDQKAGGATMLQVFSDPERRAKFFGLLNRCMAACVVLPKVSMQSGALLPDDEVFVGDIPFPDKMFIFTTCFRGRTESLDTFREGQEAGVGDMAASESSTPASS